MNHCLALLSASRVFLLLSYGRRLPLLLFLTLMTTAHGAGLQMLHGHVPAGIRGMTPEGVLDGSNRLDLAIGLPLRNMSELTNLLNQLYDPASPNYHHYLTPDEFTARFGPTAVDYEAVAAFATAHHLKVTARYANRMVLDVSGTAAAVGQAMHVKFRTYQHPTENRDFYAPDSEPALDLGVPVLHISGLDNFIEPKALNHPLVINNARPLAGSGPGGAYIGNDFRTAYVPGVALTGSGQSVGLLQFASGFYQSDISAYENQADLPNVPVQAVLLDGYNGGPGKDNAEVSLDIEMVMSMAPGVTNILVFEGRATDDILNAMAASNQVKQLSASWSYSIDATSLQIFQQFAAQGQSFFNASGDSDAYTSGVTSPCDDPYITIVGGTTLTTGAGGTWSSETVWNWGNGKGSGGGASTTYGIPSWQTNVSMTANQGSTSMRNIPDVALAADNVWVTYSNGLSGVFGGTSCATPLWAGFAALVNQQVGNRGEPPIGFINPAVYALGSSTNYNACFHDIITGNNTSSSSPSQFYAVTGYDLCTGWGTPTGQALINALATTDYLVITPDSGFNPIGGVGGPFSVTSESLVLTNIGTTALNWSLVNTSAWLKVSSTNGSLTPGGAAAVVMVSLNNTASNLVAGAYSTTLWITNLSDGVGQSLSFGLSVVGLPSITQQPTNQSVLDGATVNFYVTAAGGMPLFYQWQFNGTNLTDGDGISGSITTGLTISNVSLANIGAYSVVVTNYAGMATSSNALLTIMPSIPVITQQPTNVMAAIGSTVGFDVAAIGGKPFYYQWYFDQTNLLAGATNATLILTNVQLGNVGIYTVIVSNALGSVLSSNAILSVNPCDPAPSGIVAWWPAEWNLNDIIGGNNGTLPNGGNYTNGEVGAAFYLDGANQFVLVQTNNALLDVGQQNGFTIEGWIYPTSLPEGDNAPIIAEYENFLGSSVVTDLGVHLQIDVPAPAGTGNGCIYANIKEAPDGNDHWVTTPPNLLSVGAWQHVALTYDKASGVADIYYNGSLEASTQVGSYTPLTGTKYFLIGGRTYGNSVSNPADLFPGGLDEISVYGRALSSNEIAAIYNVGSEGKCPVPPVIIVQPTNQTAYVGSAAAFSVTATGTLPFAFQWSSNGISILDATNATLTFNNVQLSQNGSVYSVRVSNIAGSTNSSNAMLTVNLPPPCDPTPSDLVAWWPADGNTNELVSGNNASLINGAGYANGEVGMAFYLNGTNQYVLVQTNNAALDVGQQGGFTIEGWIYPTSLPTSSYALPIIAEYENVLGSSIVTNLGVHLQLDTPSVGCIYANIKQAPSSADHSFYTSANVISAGVWQHVALTYDEVSGVANIYYNGTLKASTTVGSFTPLTHTKYFLIGGRTYGNSAVNPADLFPGGLDEMSVYGRALSSNEVATIYNAGFSGKCISSLAPVITTQPTNQAVNAGATVLFKSAASGALPLSYQWILNDTNPIAGATNPALTITDVQLTNAGIYSVTVSNLYGAAISSNAVLIANDVLDHFSWNSIPAARFVNVPFTVSIQARGTTNAVFTSFTGMVLLTATASGVPVNPSISTGFVQGAWTGSVVVSQVASNLVLEANDGSGHIGLANAINVIAPPSIGSQVSGNSLLLFWPVDPAGFVLENSPTLLPAQWTSASPAPFQIGNQYLEAIPMTGSNEFYRLRFTLP